MPRPSSFASVEIETGERSQRAAVQEPDSPFHIAVLGDFSGRENRGVLDARLEGRKAILIDRDNFEDMIAQVAPELHLPLGGPDGPPSPSAFAIWMTSTPIVFLNASRFFRLCGTFVRG